MWVKNTTGHSKRGKETNQFTEQLVGNSSSFALLFFPELSLGNNTATSLKRGYYADTWSLLLVLRVNASEIEVSISFFTSAFSSDEIHFRNCSCVGHKTDSDLRQCQQ